MIGNIFSFEKKKCSIWAVPPRPHVRQGTLDGWVTHLPSFSFNNINCAASNYSRPINTVWTFKFKCVGDASCLNTIF